MEKHTLIINSEDEGKRLDVLLNQKMPELSRTQAKRLIEDEAVLVNDGTAKANYRLSVGDRVVCSVPQPVPLEVEAEDIPLSIVYEDRDLLVVDKTQGMVVHPANGNYRGTLVNALLYHCDDLSGINGVLRPGIVHRIDKDTSGLLVVAKNDMAHEGLARQIKEHTVKRIYLALVHGDVAEPGGIIDAPIGRDPKDRQRMAVNVKNGKDAVTEYKNLERLGGHYSLLECRLKTGRTHQIRVHMSFIKHPVVGDAKYGPKKVHFDLPGQALHAATLGFKHPRNDEWLEFSSGLPFVFGEVLRSLGSKSPFAKEEGGLA